MLQDTALNKAPKQDTVFFFSYNKDSFHSYYTHIMAHKKKTLLSRQMEGHHFSKELQVSFHKR